MTDSHVIAYFSRVVFDLEAKNDLNDNTEVKFALSELATVARKLYAYQKFIDELEGTLKDGDIKRRIISSKIENLEL